LEKRSIHINVFGRQFPVSADADEAILIEKAAQAVNAKIKAFKAEYKTQDDLAIAVMCCLDIMTEYLTHKNKAQHQTQSALRQLSLLEQRLDTAISEAAIAD
jgi:cell division protein ZapA (FtsZ GTPase activity inhibitor)